MDGKYVLMTNERIRTDLFVQVDPWRFWEAMLPDVYLPTSICPLAYPPIRPCDYFPTYALTYRAPLASTLAFPFARASS